MSYAIRLIDLEKHFQGDRNVFKAVDRLSMDIQSGEFVSLLGSSGCGKTTTLRMIAGLEMPSSGQILVNGTDVTDWPASKRDMRMMFQDLALFPHMTVEENIAFGLTLRSSRPRLGRDEVRKRVADYLDLAHMGSFAKRLPHQLSGGQRQRVALVRALATEPSIVLFDEPLGALDAGLRRAMQLELKRIHAALRKTFVFVTHDQDEALSMSDRIAVMHGGKILQYDTPEAIYDRPNCRYVAQFMGAANLLDASVERLDGGEGMLRLDGLGAIVAPVPDGLGVGQKVTVMFRADRALFTGEGINWIDGEHRQSVFLGNRMEHVVGLPGGQEVTVEAKIGETLVVPGAAVRFAVRPADIRVLVH
ncbi:ABC transporter ATP-binding protein [Zavarzinia compransoris]|uniref:ABC transporter ATP-binding protein n=1 Tax=Zavarzinia compransoris TaxID=1264899 RepID=A0A317E5Z6_9PROT|nr:ABC transporter ATP-binding protein [Zavarzinia compransoris]PWR21616.1 ABC transporter ATP-binding protein [Zavarzinia compransoris]TDP45604.1 putative spermidine/putrescine transport system ATP-binding protein/spermidine/putrescine transport system ATP-binding protein [Zavarzinia compransoris]